MKNKSIINIAIKEYNKEYKKCNFSKVANIIKSTLSKEIYSNSYTIMNRDFAKGIKSTKMTNVELINKIVRDAAAFYDELTFSFLDQSYKPYGSYGHWKYKESYNSLTWRSENINNLTDADNRPLFSIHIQNKKSYRNHYYNNFNLKTYNIVKNELLNLNDIEINDKNLNDKNFLLIITTKLKSNKIINQIMSDKTKPELLVYPFKNLQWALQLKDKTKPLIFQSRQTPKFKIIDKSSTLKENEFVLQVDMRCNIGINDPKKIIGFFKKEKEEKVKTLKEWNDYMYIET